MKKRVFPVLMAPGLDGDNGLPAPPHAAMAQGRATVRWGSHPAAVGNHPTEPRTALKCAQTSRVLQSGTASSPLGALGLHAVQIVSASPSAPARSRSMPRGLANPVWARCGRLCHAIQAQMASFPSSVVVSLHQAIATHHHGLTGPTALPPVAVVRVAGRGALPLGQTLAAKRASRCHLVRLVNAVVHSALIWVVSTASGAHGRTGATASSVATRKSANDRSRNSRTTAGGAVMSGVRLRHPNATASAMASASSAPGHHGRLTPTAQVMVAGHIQ